MIFVKICGLTTVPAVIAAAEAGADAAGFVFAESSPRKLSYERARALAAELPAGVLRIAVFGRAAPSDFAAACEAFGPDVIQADTSSLLGVALPPGVRSLPVVRDGDHDVVESEWMLYDSAHSGTGERADWRTAAALARRTKLVLAGGLDARNVAESLSAVRPWGVDVSSGVEEVRGVKSPRRIREFVAAVRAAERTLEDA